MRILLLRPRPAQDDRLLVAESNHRLLSRSRPNPTAQRSRGALHRDNIKSPRPSRACGRRGRTTTSRTASRSTLSTRQTCGTSIHREAAASQCLHQWLPGYRRRGITRGLAADFSQSVPRRTGAVKLIAAYGVRTLHRASVRGLRRRPEDVTPSGAPRSKAILRFWHAACPFGLAKSMNISSDGAADCARFAEALAWAFLRGVLQTGTPGRYARAVSAAAALPTWTRRTAPAAIPGDAALNAHSGLPRTSSKSC